MIITRPAAQTRPLKGILTAGRVFKTPDVLCWARGPVLKCTIILAAWPRTMGGWHLNSNTWKTVGALIALVILFGLVSAVWPALVGRLGQGSGGAGGFALPSFGSKEPGLITVPFVKNPVNPWLVLVGLLALIAVVMGGIGSVLYAIFYFGSGQVASVKADKDFQAKLSALEAARKEATKQALAAQPPTPIPSHERAGWSAVSTSLVIAFLSFVVGVIAHLNFAPEASFLTWGGGAAVIGLALSLLSFNAARMRQVDAADMSQIPWGAVWVVVTGVIFIGLGLGLMMLIRASGAS